MSGAAVSRTKTLADQVALTAKHWFRTVVPRFRQQEATSLALAEWLADHPKVQSVLHPAHPSHPDHAIWKRDFTGGGCIFSVVLKPCSVHCDPQLKRAHADKLGGPLVRFACGLEAMEDLKDDIKQAFNEIS